MVTLNIKEISNYYKSGNYPKYIITQITEGTNKFKEMKKQYDAIEDKITSHIKSFPDTKNKLWTISLLHSKIENGEQQLDNIISQLEIIRDWNNLPRYRKRTFLEAVYDCKEFTGDKWNNMDNLIKQVYNINKEYYTGVTDSEYLSCTHELIQPLYKINNNLTRITRKYKI